MHINIHSSKYKKFNLATLCNDENKFSNKITHMGEKKQQQKCVTEETEKFHNLIHLINSFSQISHVSSSAVCMDDKFTTKKREVFRKKDKKH